MKPPLRTVRQVAPTESDSGDWAIQSVNKETKTSTSEGATTSITVVVSVTYYNSSTGETQTVPPRPPDA